MPADYNRSGLQSRAPSPRNALRAVGARLGRRVRLECRRRQAQVSSTAAKASEAGRPRGTPRHPQPAAASWATEGPDPPFYRSMNDAGSGSVRLRKRAETCSTTCNANDFVSCAEKRASAANPMLATSSMYV